MNGSLEAKRKKKYTLVWKSAGARPALACRYGKSREHLYIGAVQIRFSQLSLHKYISLFHRKMVHWKQFTVDYQVLKKCLNQLAPWQLPLTSDTYKYPDLMCLRRCVQSLLSTKAKNSFSLSYALLQPSTQSLCLFLHSLISTSFYDCMPSESENVIQNQQVPYIKPAYESFINRTTEAARKAVEELY